MTTFKDEHPIASGPFQPTWESLRQYQSPDWFRDAKLGIWAHWGPQSVPMYGDWYARRMYIPGEPQYLHHWRMYGHPSKVGYKDIVKLWKAESFDPEALMKLYVDAGAKYFVAQAVHHDNVDNWNSKHHKWNAANIGPQRDIVGLWHDAARCYGLPFGLSEHLGASFSWMLPNKNADPDGPYAGVPYDGNDPAYIDLYQPNQGTTKSWYTDNAWWHKQWFLRIKDLIDQHQPDLLYSDGGVPFGDVGLAIIAHLYNTSIAQHGANRAVYTQKDKNPEVFSVGILDIERGQMRNGTPYAWQTDTCVGDWFYNVRQVYKTPKHVIEMLVDIVSKNGNLLLNIPQRPDGTLDDECLYILESLADWIKANGEGIYGSRPWQVMGEGPTMLEEGSFKEDAAEWSSADFRFTCRQDTIYAFQMQQAPGREAIIKSLGRQSGVKVAGVRLLGKTGFIEYEQTEQALIIKVTAEPTSSFVLGFAIGIM